MRASLVLLCTAIALSWAAAPDVSAQVRGAGMPHRDPQPATLAARVDDPYARVYIVTSRDTFNEGLAAFARQPSMRRDAAGRSLVIAEIDAHRLDDVSLVVHEREKRCGGYFAFDTREQAEEFVRRDRTVQAMAAPFAASYTIDNATTVLPWLPEVTASNIFDTINHLSESYQNRYYASTDGAASALWIRDRWAALAGNRSDVTAELFTACSNCSTQPSVILTITGRERPDEIVVLGAHLDSTSTGTGVNRDAPGADDDASGIATLTEVLRIAMADGWRPQRTIKFMGYAAEEVGLRGSNAIAQSFRTDNRNVVGVLQLDMTNYRGGSAVDMNIVSDFSNADLKTYFAELFDTYLAPLGLRRGTYTCGYGCSDHASWTSAAYPSAMMFESTLLPTIHTPNDSLAYVNNSVASSVNFAKFGLAFLGEMGKTSAVVDPNALPVAAFSATTLVRTVTFTNQSGDSDGSIVARRWDFGDGSTSGDIAPVKTFAQGRFYLVKLTVTDDRGGVSSTSRLVKTFR